MIDRAQAVESRLREAQRASAIAASGTVAVSQKVRDLAARGVPVINMGGGDPDFATPEHIVEAGIQALRAGETHYVNALGMPELREAIAEKMARENLVSVSPADGIVVTPGAKFAVLLSLLAHIDPGDEVLLTDPAWTSYHAMVRLADATSVRVPTPWTNGFRLLPDAIAAAITPRSRAIVISSPCNPTGHVLDEEEIGAIADVAARHDLLVVSDEIYERIAFPGTVHRSLGAHPALAHRTVTVNGFSKGYAMTGWRLGWAAGSSALMKPLQKIQQHSIYCVAPFIQRAGIAALTGPQDGLAAMVHEYQRRRDALVALLREIPSVEVTPADATFYVFPRFTGGIPSRQLADTLLDVGTVAATAGTAFGAQGEGHVRFTLRVPVETMGAVAAGVRRTLEAIAGSAR
jgi:aspartate aminotransferase